MKVKNVRPGIFLVPDADLLLAPGEVASLETASPQLNTALKKGYLVRVDPKEAQKPLPNLEPKDEGKYPEVEAEDITKLAAAEAILRVKQETDHKRLKIWAERERRRTVKNAIREQLEGGSGEPG